MSADNVMCACGHTRAGHAYFDGFGKPMSHGECGTCPGCTVFRPATVDYERAADAIDACTNMHGKLAQPERARLFAAMDSEDLSAWVAARTLLITPHVTLWQAVGCSADTRPAPADILGAIERTALVGGTL